MKSIHPLTATSALLAVIAAACAIFFGVSWYNAAHSSTAALARTRDQALQAADQAVINLNTMDYQHAAAGLQSWLNSTTGNLHAQLSHNVPAEVKLIALEQHSTTAQIMDSAITSLDPGGGTATVILAVDETILPAKGTPVSEHQAETATLTLTSSGWKLSGLSYAPSGTSSPGASSSPSSSPSPSRSR
jgi:Mce-associated membrane protein